MVRVTGPLYSQDASGTIGKVIVFSKWKGRNYVRKHVKPANPQSAKQRSRRGIIAFLAESWAALSQGSKDAWAHLAKMGNFSTFNAYTRTGADRYSQGYAPQHTPEMAITSAPCASPTVTAALVGRLATLTFTSQNPLGSVWGTALMRTGISTGPSWPADVIAILPTPLANTTYQVTDHLKAAGTYYYACRSFNVDGILDNTAAATSLVVS